MRVKCKTSLAYAYDLSFAYVIVMYLNLYCGAGGLTKQESINKENAQRRTTFLFK